MPLTWESEGGKKWTVALMRRQGTVQLGEATRWLRPAPLFMQCCGLVHRRRVRVSYVSFYCCRISARGSKYYSCLSGACCLFEMLLIPVLRIGQRINHLYNEFSRHLRYMRFWGGFVVVVFFSWRCFYISLVLCYFDKVDGNLQGDCLGSALSQRSVSVQTSWLSFT